MIRQVQCLPVQYAIITSKEAQRHSLHRLLQAQIVGPLKDQQFIFACLTMTIVRDAKTLQGHTCTEYPLRSCEPMAS